MAWRNLVCHSRAASRVVGLPGVALFGSRTENQSIAAEMMGQELRGGSPKVQSEPTVGVFAEELDYTIFVAVPIHRPMAE